MQAVLLGEWAITGLPRGRPCSHEKPGQFRGSPRLLAVVSQHPDQLRLTANSDPMGWVCVSLKGQNSEGVAPTGGSLLSFAGVVLAPGLRREVVESAAGDADAPRVMDGLDGEKVTERTVKVMIGDFVVIDEDLLEDGLVQSASDFVTCMTVELVGVKRPGFVGGSRYLIPSSRSAAVLSA
jgi:hypothetical protein